MLGLNEYLMISSIAIFFIIVYRIVALHIRPDENTIIKKSLTVGSYDDFRKRKSSAFTNRLLLILNFLIGLLLFQFRYSKELTVVLDTISIILFYVYFERDYYMYRIKGKQKKHDESISSVFKKNDTECKKQNND